MRIVNKKEFFNLPEGTLFSFYQPCNFEGLYIKGSTIYSQDRSIDFNFIDLIGNVNANDSNEFVDILIYAEENKTAFELDFDCYEREGAFDDNSLYAVYNSSEIASLSKLISNCTGLD